MFVFFNRSYFFFSFLSTFFFVFSCFGTEHVPDFRAGSVLAHSTSAPRGKVSKYNTDRILALVEEGEKKIENLRGQPLVITVGTKGAGKSTTINHLMNIPIIETDEGYLETPSTEGAAAIGHGGYCTVIPAVYSSPSLPFAFLDTRGFDPDERSPEEFIASSILTEMAVKQAGTVRIMVVANYANLTSDRGTSFIGLGRTMRKIVVGHQVPMLFLFNRYTPQGSAAQRFYRKSPAEQEKEIRNSLYVGVDKIISIEQSGFNKFAEATAARLGRAWRGLKSLVSGGASSEDDVDEEVAKDEQFQTELAKIAYTAFLQHNRELGNIAYVDPTAEERSRSSIFEALSRLAPVNPDALVFTDYNTDRVAFNGIFSESVEPLLLLVQAKMRVSKFSLDMLSTLCREATDCAAYHEDIAKSLSSAIGDVELSSLQRSYAVSEEERRKRENFLTTQITNARAKQIEIGKEITALLEQGPLKYWEDSWKQEAGFFAGWWRNYRAVYPGDVERARFEETLGSGTSRDSFEKITSSDLVINYTSSMGSDCEGTLQVYVSPKDHPSTASEINNKKTQIAGLDKAIAEHEQSLRTLRGNTQTGLKEKIEAKVRNFREQARQLAKAIDLRQRVNDLYEQYADKISLSARIEEKLNTKMPTSQRLRESYLALTASHEMEFDDRLMDGTFDAPLLDPVSIVCPGGGHGRGYSRHLVARWLKEKGTCPDCRAPANGFNPLISEIPDIIDSINGNTATTEDTFQSAMSLLKSTRVLASTVGGGGGSAGAGTAAVSDSGEEDLYY